MERAIGFRQGLYSVELTALPDHTAPRHSFLLGRAALSAASVGLDSVPCPGGNEVEDRIVYVSLESEGNWKGRKEEVRRRGLEGDGAMRSS